MTSDKMPSACSFCKTREDIFSRALQASACPQGLGPQLRLQVPVGFLYFMGLPYVRVECRDGSQGILRASVFGSSEAPFLFVAPVVP